MSHWPTTHQDYLVIAGGNHAFDFTATNAQPMTVQWFHNGGAILGATNAALMLTNIQDSQSGEYTVQVWTPSGSAISTPATLVVDTAYVALASSDFSAGREGWRFWEGDANYSPHFSWQSAGGYPSGCLFIDEYGNGDGDTTWWWAPAGFLGNKSGAYGGFLEFDLRLSARPDWGRDRQVILGSPAGRVVADAGYDPGIDWTHFRLPLTPDAWHYSNTAGPSPTIGEFLHILATLTNLLIRAEYLGVSYDDNCYLDNPRLVAPLVVTNTILVMRTTASNSATLEWPTNALGGHLEASASLASGPWSTNVTIHDSTVTNGLNVITLPTDSANRFYRLNKP